MPESFECLQFVRAKNTKDRMTDGAGQTGRCCAVKGLSYHVEELEFYPGNNGELLKG